MSRLWIGSIPGKCRQVGVATTDVLPRRTAAALTVVAGHGAAGPAAPAVHGGASRVGRSGVLSLRRALREQKGAGRGAPPRRPPPGAPASAQAARRHARARVSGGPARRGAGGGCAARDSGGAHAAVSGVPPAPAFLQHTQAAFAGCGDEEPHSQLPLHGQDRATDTIAIIDAARMCLSVETCQ